MKILLVGEYSRLHNSLKEGLKALGHEVTLIATGDYFKNYPSDIKLHRKYNEGFLKKIRVLIYHLSKVDIASKNLKKQFFSYQKQLENYDLVQLINESPLGISPKDEKAIISFLKKNNKKMVLLSCGNDYTSVKYAFDKKYRYSILTPFFEKRVSKDEFSAALKYLEPEFVALHRFVFDRVVAVIASDLDYHLPMKGKTQYFGMIPNPINTDKISFIPNPVENKVVIFHGVNRGNYLKKGNDFFDAALDQIQEKYGEKVEIIRTENIPYEQYIRSYDRAHILLDQVYAYDQGYNALEAMAKGKVVFTGAEKEWLEFYNLREDSVAINALPDVDYLVQKLSGLIENPEMITALGKNARDFIEREHHYIKIAQRYLEVYAN